jgi:hypothetical protein
MTDDWSGEVAVEKPLLNESQFSRLLAQAALLREEPWIFNTFSVMKDGMAEDDPGAVMEAWCELNEEQQGIIWLAPTYGGLWTTEERKYIQTMGSKHETD